MRDWDGQWDPALRDEYLKQFGDEDAVNFLYEESYKNKELYQMDCRTEHSLFLLKMKQSGMPFEINDLSIDEWNWMTEMQNAIDTLQIEKAKQK